MVVAHAVAILLLASLAVPAQDGASETVRRRLEEMLHAGQRSEAAAEAARLAGDPGVPPAQRRVGAFIRCQVLHGHFRLSRSRPHVAAETARQAERAWREFLSEAGDTPTDLKARYLFGLFLQDRARWRLDLNDVLYATEIDRDLTESNRTLRAVVDAVPASSGDPELAAIRRWSRARVCINFYFFARLYSPDDARHRVHLMLALDELEKIAQEYPGLPAGNLAYFYYGLAWTLYGSQPAAREAREKAREIFLDLWKAVPWTEENAPFLEEVLWNICRLDLRHGEPGRVVIAATLLKQRHRREESVPSRHAVLVLGEAAVARLAAEGAKAAADAFEADAAWLERRGSTAIESHLADAAARLAEAARSRIRPATHPRLFILASRGILRRGDALQALAWVTPLLRRSDTPARLRRDAFEAASHAWEARGFLREALQAHELGQALHAELGPEEAHEDLRRGCALWQRIARRSSLASDRARLEQAQARVPRPAGDTEFEAGMRAYDHGALAEAITWLDKVGPGSRFHPIALAMRAHVRYLTLPPSADRRGELGKILLALEELDAVSPRAPNWLPAQALRNLTQAMVRRALGDLDGAARDLAGFETQFASQPHLVAEALKLRTAVAIQRDRPEEALTTLATLRERFPGQRALGEACLILGRHLRSDGAAENERLAESVRLRRESRRILGREFSSRERYLLAVDEMALGEVERALAILDQLARRDPPVLRGVRDALALRRVRCLLALDRARAADAVLADVLRRKPNHLEPLRLEALALGGTVVRQGDELVERRYLDRSEEAFAIWERIKRHAELEIPYGALWYEAQFHIALLNYRAGNVEMVRARYRWIESSGYALFDGHAFAEQFRWLAERVPPE